MNIIIQLLDRLSAVFGCTMTCANLTWKMVLIVSALVFIGSFMDSIAGGGGIVTVPAYLLAGLPAHLALGTNKLSACIGASVAVTRYIKNRLIKWHLVIPGFLLAILGSYFGTRLQLMLPETYLQYLLLIVLPLVAFVVLRQRSLPEESGDIGRGRQFAVVCLSSLIVGAYDGFYGPGTGTFLLLIFCNIAKLDVRSSIGSTRLINFASNFGAMFTSLLSGKVFFALGLIGALASVLGNYLGSGLAIKNGSKIVRPMVIAVLILLTIKVVSGLI